MQNQLYDEVINKLNSMKENRSLENQVKKIDEILYSNGLKSGKDYIISSRYKTVESIAEKLSRKSYKYAGQVTDLAGIKIVFKDLDVTMKAKEIISSNLEVIQEDNYYKDQRNTGYKSIHFNIENENRDVIELQIKDKINDLKQEYCHSHIYKNKGIKEDAKVEINEYMNNVIEDYYRKKEELDIGYFIKEDEQDYFDEILNEKANEKREIKKVSFKGLNEIVKEERERYDPIKEHKDLNKDRER